MDQCNKNNGNHATCATIALLTGIAIGAVVTALTTKKTGVERRNDLESLVKHLRTRAESLTNEANEAWNAVKKYSSNTGEHFKQHCNPDCSDDDCRFDSFESDIK